MTIATDDEIRSGKAVVKGTRVTVEDIVETFHKLGRSVSEVSQDFGISEEEVEEALRYSRSRNSTEVKA
jgi:uncharacterized protein (DUF433 family)